MTTTIPGIADKMRKEASRQLAYRKYAGSRRQGVLTAIQKMPDDIVLGLGPSSELERLATDYPKGSADWRVWDHFRQRLDTLLDRTTINEWAGQIIERALTTSEESGRAA